MPQVPSYPFVNPSRAQTPGQLDANGVQMVGTGRQTRLNITAATVVKAAPGRIGRVSVLVVGTTVGTVNDLATTAGAAVTNEVGVIPMAVGTYDIDMPCAVGILVTPGTGQTLAVSYI